MVEHQRLSRDEQAAAIGLRGDGRDLDGFGFEKAETGRATTIQSPGCQGPALW